MASDDSNSDSKAREERIFDENGVDLTLIRYSLSLSPTERLKSVENFMNAMATVRPIRRAGV